MTRDEILTMPAGRKMDAMIYESIFKNRVEVLTSKLDPHYVEYLVPSDGTDYSTDIATAWKVVEKLTEISETERSYFDLARMENYYCNFGEYGATAETAPLAICRAALLTVMETE